MAPADRTGTHSSKVMEADTRSRVMVGTRSSKAMVDIHHSSSITSSSRRADRAWALERALR